MIPDSILNPAKKLHERAKSALLRPRVDAFVEIAKPKPLMLKVETINICNAACVFCGYTSMKRKKGIMSLEIFEKVVRGYSEMGGGALTLTPIVGDPLLDPELMQRMQILGRYPNINQISFTTNGIAMRKYSDDDLRLLLERLFMLQFSIGGLDRDTYKELYAVDRYEEVNPQLERILELKKAVGSKTQIHFAFRTNDPRFLERHKERLDSFRARGALISHICDYHNFGGTVGEDGKAKAHIDDKPAEKREVCSLPLTGMAVQWDGKVSGCGCVDLRAENGLTIGSMETSTLKEVWEGKRREGLMGSFARGKPPGLCQGCTAYCPVTHLVQGGAIDKVDGKSSLPLEFYTGFSGG